jgi:uncharacterized protein (TIGR00106 family)
LWLVNLEVLGGYAMALMQITVIPLGGGSASVGEYVADMKRWLDEEGFVGQMNDMGTVLHGKAADLLVIAGRLHERPFVKGIHRVVTQIVLDDRRDKEVAVGDKVASVNARLASPRE